MCETRALNRMWIVLAGVFLVMLSGSAMAQESGAGTTSLTASSAELETETERFRTVEAQLTPAEAERALDERTREELLAQGFVFEDAASAQSRAVGTLLGATAGLVLRGIGHWYVDDYPTAASLLGAQVLSLALIGTGFGLKAAGDESGLASSAMYLGTGLFVLSYAVDVLGTAYSDELGLPVNTLEPRRFGVQLRYIYIQDDWHDLHHLINGEVKADFLKVYGSVRTVQDVYLDLNSYGGGLGWRAWQGNSKLTWAALELEGDFQVWKGRQAENRVEASALLGASLDLGDVFSHLEHFAVGIHIGIGQRFVSHHATELAPRSDWAQSRSYIPMEIFTHMNLSESLNARFAYSRWRNHYLETNQALVGLALMEFVYESAENLDLVFRGELGSGFALSAALNVWFWDR